MPKLKLKSKFIKIIRKQALKLWLLLSLSDPLSNPLMGDRCVEYGFVIKILGSLGKTRYKSVLDIGCFASPLTTIIKEIGFNIDGIDLIPSPYIYDGVNYIQGDFISVDFKISYDVIVLCSTIEHIGLKGRYGSAEIKEGDIKTLKKVKNILNTDGILILTIPYGIEKTIRPLHRVYNKKSELLKYAYVNFKILQEEFYKKSSQNIWIKCEENEAREVDPSENNYALGLFAFIKKST
jgi:SAM-dependent methyltransferase